MSTPVRKPKENPFASLPFQDNEESEDEQIVTDEVVQKEEERELSDEEDFDDGDDNDNDDDDDEEGDEFGANVKNDFDEDEFEVDFETEEDDHDSLDDEEDEFRNASETEPGCFLPDQPYIPPPNVPKPEPSSSNLIPYILSMFRDVSVIYLQFVILLILVYSCALMYVLYNNGNLTLWTDTDEDDIATCPVVYAYKYQIEE